MPMLQGCNIEAALATFMKEIARVADAALEGGINPAALLELETAIADTSRELADEVMAAVLRMLLTTTALDRMAVRAFKNGSSQRYKDEGLRPVKIHLGGGGVYSFHVTYLRWCKPKKRGRPKGCGKRGPSGKGCFPVLELLGIHSVHGKMKASALFEERVIYAMSAADSHQAARQMLEKWGISIGHGALQNFFEHAGNHYCAARDEWLDSELDNGPVEAVDLQGKRVCITVDGGRARCRKNKPGRALASGYHRFDADWKEPKIFCIYVIDTNGKRLRSVRSIIDGVMVADDAQNGADKLFKMLEKYLRCLRIERANEVIFSADGAPWIWNRARPMLEELGVKPGKITEVLDWFHASETLHNLSELPTGWSKSKRIGWRLKALDQLAKGDIEAVLKSIDTLAEAPGAGKAKSKREYFSRNTHRLNFPYFKARNIPRGSGAVESAVRRVINLRIKSNGKFWNAKNIATMLLWRGYLKTERLGDLCAWSRRFRTQWWSNFDQRQAQNMLAAA